MRKPIRVNAGDAGEHVMNKVCVAWYIYEADACCITIGACDIEIGEAGHDREPATSFFFQRIGVFAGQGLDECGFAMVDVPGGRNNHYLGIFFR